MNRQAAKQHKTARRERPDDLLREREK